LLFPLHISRAVLLLLRQRRGRGNDLGTRIKYLQKTTSGAVGIGLGTTIKYPRRRKGATAGNGLGTMLNYLRGAAGNGLGTTIKCVQRTTSSVADNGRAERSSTCDAQRAAPWATAWAPRSSSCAPPRA
jgi:hypothetical protein